MDTQASSSSVSWQWESDSGWLAYDKETSAIIETAHSQKLPSVNLTHGFFSTPGGYTIDFSQMLQLRNSAGTTRKIQRIPAIGSASTEGAPTPSNPVGDFSLFGGDDDEELSAYDEQSDSSKATDDDNSYTGAPYWEWFGDRVWQRYDTETSQMIEDAYSLKQPVLQLTHGFFGASGGYTINLTTFTQTRENSGYARQIKRKPPAMPVPGGDVASSTSRRRWNAFGAPPAAPEPAPARKTHRPEVIRGNQLVMGELYAALQALSRREVEVEGEVQVEEIYVED